MKNACVVGMTVALLTLGGCKDRTTKDAESPGLGRVAVVDIDKVALGVGDRAKITDAAERDAKDLNAAYEARVQSAQAELAALRKKFGASPTAEQEKQVQTRQGELEQSLGNLRAQANATASARHNERIQAFRELVKPIATQLAKAGGFTMVVTPQPTMVWSDDSVDLTGKVIEKLNAIRQAGAPAQPPAPAAPAP